MQKPSHGGASREATINHFLHTVTAMSSQRRNAAVEGNYVLQRVLNRQAKAVIMFAPVSIAFVSWASSNSDSANVVFTFARLVPLSIYSSMRIGY